MATTGGVMRGLTTVGVPQVQPRRSALTVRTVGSGGIRTPQTSGINTSTPQTLTSRGAVGDIGETIGGRYGGDLGASIGGLLGTLIDRKLQPSEPAQGSPPIPGLSSGQTCDFPRIKIGDRCVDPTAAAPGGDPFITPAGYVATTGRYGAGYTPVLETRAVRRCPAGSVLGNDGVCYDKLARTKRMWDPGRKPLLTGGDRNAITRAKRAARKLVGAQESIAATTRMLAKAADLKVKR